ncbi:hypothetical protein DPMN_004335 [Dreissena polymorpha]|uniref:Uncharacterized protein n=1 Tax=Dreissena polymorpha TaxID=45954 RepID=A0A9D4MRK2_DREPO|nr:hypothetical protein DPMN_004335 [Dreissena polymorpha]
MFHKELFLTLLSNFDKECLRNVNARVLTNQMWTNGGQSPTLKPHLSNQLEGVKFDPRGIIGANKTNLFIEFHDDWAKNVTSRKMRPPLGSHVLQRTGSIFELNSCILDQKYVTSRVFTSKSAPPLGGHVFSPIWTIFELIRDINNTNVLTKFHDDWAKILTSREFTRKTAPPTSSHVFLCTGTTF